MLKHCTSLIYQKIFEYVCIVCSLEQLGPKAISHWHISGTRYVLESHSVLHLLENPQVLHHPWRSLGQQTWRMGISLWVSFLSLEGSPQMQWVAQ